MRRAAAGVAEVRECFDQATAEMVEPDPVDHHPGGQRMVRVDQPAGHRQPTTRRVGARPGGLDRQRRFSVGQDTGDTGADAVARLVVLAPAEQPGRGRVAAVPKRPDSRLDRHFCLELLDPVVGGLGEFLEPGVLFLECRDGDRQPFLELAGQVLLHRVPLLRGCGEHPAKILPEDLRKAGQSLLGVLFFQGRLEVGEFLFRVGDLFFDDGARGRVSLLLDRGQVGQHAADRLALGLSGDEGRFEPVVDVVGSLEHGDQPVVIPLRDRVVLVIVTLGTFDGQSKDG